MDINELKEHLKKVLELRDELKDLPRNGRCYTLWEYIGLFREKLINVDHGEADLFAEPARMAGNRLDILADIGEEKFNAAFATNKAKLLAILQSYLKGLQSGLRKLD
jgi:hypothetical protein